MSSIGGISKAGKAELKAVKTRLSGAGAIHTSLREVEFVATSGEVVDKRLCIAFARPLVYGMESEFALVYRHQNGDVVLHSNHNTALTITTLRRHVLPVMENFNKTVKQIKSQRSPSVICSKGGCRVCTPKPSRKAKSK